MDVGDVGALRGAHAGRGQGHAESGRHRAGDAPFPDVYGIKVKIPAQHGAA